jgi:uncharacterized protein (DUF58 family)
LGLLDRASKRLLEQLRLSVRPSSAGAGQGEHRSQALASGVEFADHRKYVVGDDVRSIDWKAFARHRQLMVKVFEEEREVRIYILLDVSKSMTRGEPPKLRVAKAVAAAFSYLGMKQFDQVRVVAFSGDLGQEHRAGRSRAFYPLLEKSIEALEVESITGFNETVRSFAKRYAGRGLVVVVTDLMDPSDWGEGFRNLARLGHELCVVRITCAEDERPEFKGELELLDAETGQQVRVRVSPSLLKTYREEVSAHVERCRESCLKVGGRFVEASVEHPIQELLKSVLAPAVEVA